MAPDRFRAAIERFDAANAADPHREPDSAGVEEAKFADILRKTSLKMSPRRREAARIPDALKPAVERAIAA